MNTHDVQERSWVHPLEGARIESAPQVSPRGVPTMKRLWIYSDAFNGLPGWTGSCA
jgi:hypothetical protein